MSTNPDTRVDRGQSAVCEWCGHAVSWECVTADHARLFRSRETTWRDPSAVTR